MAIRQTPRPSRIPIDLGQIISGIVGYKDAQEASALDKARTRAQTAELNQRMANTALDRQGVGYLPQVVHTLGQGGSLLDAFSQGVSPLNNDLYNAVVGQAASPAGAAMAALPGQAAKGQLEQTTASQQNRFAQNNPTVAQALLLNPLSSGYTRAMPDPLGGWNISQITPGARGTGSGGTGGFGIGAALSSLGKDVDPSVMQNLIGTGTPNTAPTVDVLWRSQQGTPSQDTSTLGPVIDKVNVGQPAPAPVETNIPPLLNREQPAQIEGPANKQASFWDSVNLRGVPIAPAARAAKEEAERGVKFVAQEVPSIPLQSTLPPGVRLPFDIGIGTNSLPTALTQKLLQYILSSPFVTQ